MQRGIFPLLVVFNDTAQHEKMQHEICGEVLQDFDSGGKGREWSDRKMANELLAMAYQQVNENKAARLRSCSDFLEFAVTPTGKKLTNARFCRVRLCPICQWRRSLKTFAQTQKIINAIETNDKQQAYILLTLTMKNCQADELTKSIDHLMAAWNNMSRRAAWKKIANGWNRSLEVTHNVDPTSPSYDTYHPHFHVLIAVNKSYFTSRDYLSHAKWVEMWQHALGVNYEPKVNVKRAREIYGTIAEISKYTTAEEDYIVPNDWDLTVDAVRALDRGLNNRRLVAYGGNMAEWHKRLNLTDVEDGDLINLDDDSGDGDVTKDCKIVVYRWYSGYRQYRKEQ